MTTPEKDSGPDASVQQAARDLLGYLNFSTGAHDEGTFRHWNTLFAAHRGKPLATIRELLKNELAQVAQSEPAFRHVDQADAVIGLIFDAVMPAYWQFHEDLFFHLEPDVLNEPYFVGVVAEAVLAQGEPWDQTDRIVEQSLAQLNDFIGYRPIAVLENGRQMEVYPRERFRPLPIFLKTAGAAVGRYQDLISHTLGFLENLPAGVVAATHFQLENLQELAVDPRSYDYNHPVYKRTNYLFGEWDPHQIGVDGYYHRFVVRKIIMDALVDWINHQTQFEQVPYEEALYDASAALSGTILMASSISGAGPDTFDSNISLSSLLPIVARQRDYFYERLMDSLSGPRAERLRKHQQETQQPFGHVRHALNIYLSTYGASQVRNRELALMYARMGFAEESRRQAAQIPAASIRFEAEIQWRIRIGHQHVQALEFEAAEQLLSEIEDLERRAIESGAFVDPWNILGFQGQFTLFANREDTVPDIRVESLIDLKERVFNLYAQLLREAAINGATEVASRVSFKFQQLAEAWDQYATTTVNDIPQLFGQKSFESAQVVARTLANWKQSEASENSMTFWNRHLEMFDSQIAYQNIVAVLLEKRDLDAALGLLMQWLSQSEESQSVQFNDTFSSAMTEWTRVLQAEQSDPELLWQRYRRIIELLEANAGHRWGVPRLLDETQIASQTDNDDWWDQSAIGESEPWNDNDDAGVIGEDDFDAADDEADEPFAAAYEGVTFRDSADDGQDGSVSDSGSPWADADNEFERWTQSYEPQLRFLQSLADIIQQAIIAAARQLYPTEADAGKATTRPATSGEPSPDREPGPTDVSDESGDTSQAQSRQATPAQQQLLKTIAGWSSELLRFERELTHLLHEVHVRQVGFSPGTHDANVEYDTQLQSKLYLMHNINWTLTRLRFVHRVADALVFDRSQKSSPGDRWMTEFLNVILQNDVRSVRKLLPGFLQKLQRRKLLYVPLDNGGTPRAILDALEMHTLLRFCVTALPGLGMYRETWHTIETAYRMERGSRPRGPAITEFDRLFRLALSNTLNYLLRSSANWQRGRISDEDLIEILAEVVDHFGNIWVKHSHTMRLSAAESLKDDQVWDSTRQFIRQYGAELFHARNLTLGYIRAIVQSGVEEFLEYLEHNDDPLHPHPLIQDIQQGKISTEDAVGHLDLIYGILIDKFERFLEYNSTTTLSDYGDRFDCLLDFLRLEADYDRDDWTYLPLKLAHESLIEIGRFEAAQKWEEVFARRSAERADEHLQQLRTLEHKYGVKLPALNDHIGERFVKPLAVNRMVALVRDTMAEENPARRQEQFDDLRVQIENYQDGTFGTGLEVPEWLRLLDQQVRDYEFPDQVLSDPYGKELITPIQVNLREMRRQLKNWDDPVLPSKRKSSKRPRDKS